MIGCSFLPPCTSLRREGDYSFHKTIDIIMVSSDKLILNYDRFKRNGGEFLSFLMNNEVAYADE